MTNKNELHFLNFYKNAKLEQTEKKSLACDAILEEALFSDEEDKNIIEQTQVRNNFKIA